VPDVTAGLAIAYLPAAALDSAMHRPQPRHWRHCGQGKAPSPRRGWSPVSRSPASTAGILHRWDSIRPRRFAGARQSGPKPI